MNSTDTTCVNLVGLEYYENRLKTFDTYPKQMKPDKYQLARAGLYYTGNGDIVICFRCGVKISSWERHDNAMLEHYRLSANCDFVRMVGIETPLGLQQSTRPFGHGAFVDIRPPETLSFGFGSNSMTGANLFVKSPNNQ